MQQATFRLAGGGAYAAATADTDVRMALWCNDHCDLLQLRGADADSVLAEVDERVGVRERVAEGDTTLAVTAACLRAESAGIEDVLAAHGCLLVPPLAYADGEKQVRVLALSPSALTGVYHDLRERYDVTVADKREVSAPDPGAPGVAGADLTARQAAVLRAAVDGGYYEFPRGTTTTELAQQFGLARSTLEEHLRRAEGKVAAAFAADR
ncbi:helix-turn-helix domain-containing protein [Halobacterium litoreum]|uniref:Helix-turn-helix domain-containing protein n=1 Tax=Halobacterium litoreum TaxID=2039234 RepID=A0ABD5NI36_9EURY|nr:helix-turn-helix domain-containing protein [Halobacterium litoreum]UHH12272.1 helix-turn-helix domain-containing protein [Halobacterium litoreum]